ncbi:MAG: phage terminase large subunit [Melioribacteraceae bacterium]|nr:phage terminase large subunit [Melioribacteraceae bacterium]
MKTIKANIEKERLELAKEAEKLLHKVQYDLLIINKSRFKIIAKGRRFGLTRGLAIYTVKKMIEGTERILWVDTTYSNIQRYFFRYFMPVLKLLKKDDWKYLQSRSELRIFNCLCDFRSADRPQNLEGFGYELIILNEAGIILNDSNLWNESIRPMVMDYKANVIIGGTPKGKFNKRAEKHLFYDLFQKGEKDGKQWKAFNYSSYENPLLDKEEVKQLEADLSPALRKQEIYGKFIDHKGEGIIKNSYWVFSEIAESFPSSVKIIQSWDTAFKKSEENDYSVCTTWAITNNNYLLLDVWRQRVEFPELKKKFIELYEKFKPTEVIVEDKGSGISLIQELESNTRIPVKKIKVDKDKIARCNAVTPLLEAHKVILKKDAIWINDFIYECEEFPNCQFDDQLDSMVQFLNYAKNIPQNTDFNSSIVSIKHSPSKHRGYKKL